MQSLTPANDVRRKDDKSGYVTPNGFMPSVTTIIGQTAPEESKRRLEQWLKRPNAAKESALACKRGSWMHQQIENHLQGKPVEKHLAFGGYLDSILPWVKENVIDPVGIECPIWHPMGFSGTFDCLAHLVDDHVDDLTLLDWKSSRTRRSDDLVYGYKLQLAAYRLGLSHTYSVTPNKAMLVIGRPSATKPDIWEVNEEELDQLEVQFIERLQRYQNELSPVQ